jgi:hypothetical protein
MVSAANKYLSCTLEEKWIPVLQPFAKGGTPLPLFFAKTNKHAGENEHDCKKHVQKLDSKKLTNQTRLFL